LTFNRNSEGIVTDAVIDDRGAQVLWTKTNKPLPAHVEIKLAPETLNRYAGDYQLIPGFILRAERIWRGRDKNTTAP